MKKTILLKSLPLLLIASGLVLTVAFAQTNTGKQKAPTADTVPTKQKKIRDLDEALDEIDRAETEMQRSFKDVDQEKMEADIRKAMKEVDINMAKVKEDLAKSMKEFDKQKIQLEVQKAMQQIDAEKIKKEVQEALDKVDTVELKAELEKVKEIDMTKMKEQLANIQPQVEKAMKEAKVSIEKARKEVTAYRNLVNALDRDGLLKKSENYTVEYKNKSLTVNGKKLSPEDTKKYSEYLTGKDDFTLQKEEDGMNIHND